MFFKWHHQPYQAESWQGNCCITVFFLWESLMTNEWKFRKILRTTKRKLLLHLQRALSILFPRRNITEPYFRHTSLRPRWNIYCLYVPSDKYVKFFFVTMVPVIGLSRIILNFPSDKFVILLSHLHISVIDLLSTIPGTQYKKSFLEIGSY